MIARFSRLIGGLNAVGTLLILALMVLINADVLGREVLGRPIRGVTEMVSLSIVAIVFLQISHTLWVGRITRNDALLSQLARRLPACHRALEATFHLVGASLFALLAFSSWHNLDKAWAVHEYVGALGDFILPTWPVRLIIVVGSVVTSVAFLIRVFQPVERSP